MKSRSQLYLAVAAEPLDYCFSILYVLQAPATGPRMAAVLASSSSNCPNVSKRWKPNSGGSGGICGSCSIPLVSRYATRLRHPNDHARLANFMERIFQSLLRLLCAPMGGLQIGRGAGPERFSFAEATPKIVQTGLIQSSATSRYQPMMIPAARPDPRRRYPIALADRSPSPCR